MTREGARVFKRSETKDVKEYADAAMQIARLLSSDEKFRDHLLRASDHAGCASRRVRSRFGRLAAFREIVLDQRLRSDLVQMVAELRGAWDTVELERGSRRSHRRPSSLALLAMVGVAAAIVASRSSRLRKRVVEGLRGEDGDRRAREEEAEGAAAARGTAAAARQSSSDLVG
jgi:hypothetical protein